MAIIVIVKVIVIVIIKATNIIVKAYFLKQQNLVFLTMVLAILVTINFLLQTSLIIYQVTIITIIMVLRFF